MNYQEEQELPSDKDERRQKYDKKKSKNRHAENVQFDDYDDYEPEQVWYTGERK